MERIGAVNGRLKRKRVLLTLAMLFLALVVSAGPAGAQSSPAPGPNQAFLYEMSEDATLPNYLGHLLLPDPTGTSPTGLIDSVTGSTAIPDVVPVARNAVSALQGYASYPSPLCPLTALVTVPKTDTCTITLTGYDSVPLVNGTPTIGGSVWGTLEVVVQLDNPADSPEFPVVPGFFFGTITFGQPGVPIGSASGTFVVGAALPQNVPAGDPASVSAALSAVCNAAPVACHSFNAKFRQPFTKDASGNQAKARRNQDAFYLLDNGKTQAVKSDERAVGWPTVRFEVSFF